MGALKIQYNSKANLRVVYKATQNGTVVEQTNYDPWGRIRDPQTWQYDNTAGLTLIYRGYTGHEHLSLFGGAEGGFTLINMNGRMYDPVLGRMLSPDNYVQSPSNPQNYNRYAYVLNNPLKYVDPSGEKWWHWLLTDIATGGLISGTVSSISLTTYSTLFGAASTFQGIASGLDFSTILIREAFTPETNPIQNSFAIEAGLILAPFSIFSPADKTASDEEKAMQIIIGITGGEAIQTLFGNGFAHIQNLKGNIDKVGYYGGRTIVRVKDDSFNNYKGVSHGHYIFGEDISLNPNDVNHDINLFYHEYGHSYQSRTLGPQYYIKVGYYSAFTDDPMVEDNANYKAYMNFGVQPYNGMQQEENHFWEILIGPLTMFKL